MTKLSPWLPYHYCGQSSLQCLQWHDDVIKWKHFPCYWPFVWGIHRSPVNSPHKGQWRGALMFSLICTWTNAWVNNPDTDDSRHPLWRRCNGWYNSHPDDLSVSISQNYFDFGPILGPLYHVYSLQYKCRSLWWLYCPQWWASITASWQKSLQYLFKDRCNQGPRTGHPNLFQTHCILFFMQHGNNSLCSHWTWELRFFSCLWHTSVCL